MGVQRYEDSQAGLLGGVMVFCKSFDRRDYRDNYKQPSETDANKIPQGKKVNMIAVPALMGRLRSLWGSSLQLVRPTLE